MNVFVEGVPGSGKSTLLYKLSKELPEYTAYYEGDLNPIDLAWCAKLEEAQYRDMLSAYPSFRGQIEGKTCRQGECRIVAYTKVPGMPSAFYRDMESLEVYGGRLPIADFEDMVLSRFCAYRGSGSLFECAFFQNVLEELMLFGRYDQTRCMNFYRRLLSCLDGSRLRLIRLLPENLEDSIRRIQKERVNENGEEEWFSMMLRYLNDSPYGREHPFRGFQDVLDHFRRRIALETEILQMLPKTSYLNLISQKYTMDTVKAFLR